MSIAALDPTFGIGGTQQFDPKSDSGTTSVDTLPNNDFLVAGPSGVRFGPTNGVFVARYTANGKVDNRFGHHGRIAFDTGSYVFNTVAALPGGRIVLLLNNGDNSQFSNTEPDLLIGLTWRGKLDNHFGNSGKVKLAAGEKHTALAVTPAGKIVVAGTRLSESATTHSDFTGLDCVIEQLASGGQFDKKFGSGGTITANVYNVSDPVSLAVSEGQFDEELGSAETIIANAPE